MAHKLFRLLVPLIILMLAGLLWSRALLSMSMMLFMAISILSCAREIMPVLRSSWWLKGSIVLFFWTMASGAWSSDAGNWWTTVQVKLPLLLFPMCVPAFTRIDDGQRRMLLMTVWVMLLLSGMYSYWHLWQIDVAGTYARAKVVKVPMSGDHVRYTWFLVIVYMWTLHEVFKPGLVRSPVSKLVLQRLTAIFPRMALFMLAWLALLIHVVAAKTGLIGFYLVNLLAILMLVPRRWLTISVAAMMALPMLAWISLPSFQNRLRFVWWDFQNYSRGNYVEGLSDAPRVLSVRAGVDMVQEYPWLGVGFGDVKQYAWRWYSANASFLQDYEKLLPSNEVLIFASGAGVFAGACCLVWLLLPFFMKQKDFLWLAFHSVAFTVCMYEIMLEVQYGVFLFAFFGCAIYRRL